MDSTKPRIARITIGRLYNLGSYEHVRYELAVEVPEGASATATLEGIERIFAALNPKGSGVSSETEIKHDERRIQDMKDRLAKDPEDFERYYGRGHAGTHKEYIARCEQSAREAADKRQAWKAQQKKARALLDDLGGAAEWKDAKLDWDDDDY